MLKDDLISMVVHDLKNPLMSIIMSINVLSDSFEDITAPDQRQSFDLIRYNSETILRMINDMLDIQRIESGKLSLNKISCSICELIKNAVKQLRVPQEAADVEIAFTVFSRR